MPDPPTRSMEENDAEVRVVGIVWRVAEGEALAEKRLPFETVALYGGSWIYSKSRSHHVTSGSVA